MLNFQLLLFIIRIDDQATKATNCLLKTALKEASLFDKLLPSKELIESKIKVIRGRAVG
jgi:hypothetical protein